MVKSKCAIPFIMAIRNIRQIISIALAGALFLAPSLSALTMEESAEQLSGKALPLPIQSGTSLRNRDYQGNRLNYAVFGPETGVSGAGNGHPGPGPDRGGRDGTGDHGRRDGSFYDPEGLGFFFRCLANNKEQDYLKNM